MYKRYYDGYNTYQADQAAEAADGEVVIPETADTAPPETDEPTDVAAQETISVSPAEDTAVQTASRAGGIFDNVEIDDLLLIGVIILLLHDSTEDSLLVVILAVVFIAGLLD